jgi:hypothetical protein
MGIATFQSLHGEGTFRHARSLDVRTRTYLSRFPLDDFGFDEVDEHLGAGVGFGVC